MMSKTLADIFGNWQAHDVEIRNAMVAAAKQSTRGTQRPLSTSVTAGATPATPSLSLESELHEYILDWCHIKGWLAIHSRMDKKATQAKGVSDFILVCPNTVAFVECKKRGNKPTKEQLQFLAHVKKMGWPNAVVYSKEEFHLFIDPLI
jgi:hypothetical protein